MEGALTSQIMVPVYVKKKDILDFILEWLNHYQKILNSHAEIRLGPSEGAKHWCEVHAY